MPTKKNLDLIVETEMLTAGAAAEIINAILEFLLFQRNQIPFVYKTYKYYVTSWSETDCNDENPSLMEYQLERQREQAKATRDAISKMRQMIKKSLESNSMRSMRFLFGATTFTPKEAYTIHLPVEAISHNHCYEHHRFSQATLNQTLISLLTNEDLYAIFSNNLAPTNLYLEFETLGNCQVIKNQLLENQITAKEYCSLPASCKDIHIHLQHKLPLNIDSVQSFKCCKELKVFEEFLNLKLVKEDNNVADDKCSNVQVNNDSQTEWWEADIIVRGFKEKTNKGFKLWAK